MTSGAPLDAVLLTGRPGAGKTSVAVALGDLLDARGLPYAVVDLDWLCWAGPDLTGGRLLALLVDNLAGVTVRLRAEGVRHLVLARAVSSVTDVARLREAVAPSRLRVVHLGVPAEVARQRLTARPSPTEDLALGAALAAPVAADAVVRNDDGAPPPAVAARVLAALGWGAAPA